MVRAGVLVAGLLALAVAATAQTATGVNGAPGPAERRLHELIAAVESGSSTRIRAYVREAYAPEVWQRSNEDRVVQWYTSLYDRSRGFDIDSLRATPTEAAALLLSPKPEAGHWGYGFDVLDEERRVVGHGGGWTGVSTSLDMFTTGDYTSVILSNHSNVRSPLREAIWSILP